MKLLILSFLTLSVSYSYAKYEVLTIKDDKAVIQLTDKELKVGDKVVSEYTSLIDTANTGKKVEIQTVISTPLQFKREHQLSWQYSGSTLKAESDSVDSESTNRDMIIEYTRNWGYYQIGGFIATDFISDKDSEVFATQIGISGRYNFIENKPGNNLIPFAGLYLSTYHSKYDDSDNSNDFTIKGPLTGLGIGLDWFPFSELFALTARLISEVGDLKVEGEEIEVTSSMFTVGWSLYF